MKRFLPLLLIVATGCLSSPPVHPRALECNELCAQYIGTGDLTRAEVQCDLGLQFSPQYADLWVQKGLIALRRGQTPTAKEHFIKALRYNQEQAQAYNNLGYIYYQEHAYGKAHDNFQRALKVNPDYTEARYNLALTFKDMGEKEKAKKELRTLTAINGALADPYAQLGIILLDEGALDEAVENLRRAVELDAKFSDAWLALGNAYMEQGKFAEAVDAYTSCIEGDPDHAQCRNNVPLAQKKAALAKPALEDARRTAAGENTAAQEYGKARAFRESGLRAEEERAYLRCVKFEPKYAACHFGLYEIYQGDRRDKEAFKACKNFLKFAESTDFPKQVETCERYLASQTY
ncbi:MAG: tetratricopeptide repeat protein [Myxococcaceae bacterium]|nr:tetratricopeptide repeat protein [Myxococcaceae bacterium]